jgi:hypothetical protein
VSPSALKKVKKVPKHLLKIYKIIIKKKRKTTPPSPGKSKKW